jgi:hypothetical protein
MAIAINTPLTIFKDINPFEGRLLPQLLPGIASRTTLDPSISSISVIEYTDVRLIFSEAMRLIRIRLKLCFDRACVAIADKLCSELERIIVISQDRIHRLRMTVPMTIDSLKGFSCPYGNSRISRHIFILP